jgi:hypothetical protein
MPRTIQPSESTGGVMTLGEYFAATALVAVILWGVLGLLMQDG